MSNTIKCPICLNANFANYGGKCRMVSITGTDSSRFECDVCGKYEISGSAFAGPLDPENATLTPIQRAALSHRLRIASREGTPSLIMTDWLKDFLANASLPSPAIQAANIIRYVGDETSKSGEKLPILPVDFHSIIGAPNREFVVRLAEQLFERKLLSLTNPNGRDGVDLRDIYLTLDGWERFEAEKSGKVSGKYGFIAMEFGDAVLDPFVRNIMKPAVKKGIGYDLLDMRDIARAGIVDNIMRTQIRDAAFVIVDLTHDNPGAYWEAGYAEGLGKPVIYICEKSKFDNAKTHFDTNHSTTVMWSQGNGEDFSQELVATLRRSLNLFSGIA